MVIFSIPFYLLFFSTCLVLVMYIYLYRALNQTLNKLAKLVNEFNSPKQTQRKENIMQGEQDYNLLVSDTNAAPPRDGVQVVNRGKILRSYSTKMFKRPENIQEKQAQHPVTIELPWASIKTRFHIFFALSIFFLVYSIVMFFWVRIVAYPPRSIDSGLKKLPGIVRFLFWLHTLLTSIGLLVYSIEIDDKYLQNH